MDNDDQTMLVCAFRYALGKRTYVTSVVARKIIKLWKEIPKVLQEALQDEITKALNDGKAGDQPDIAEWTQVLYLPINEI